MANRRFGNQGNQRGGLNRSFGGGGGGGPSPNINPWQGGVAPGNPGNNIQNQLALALTSLIQQTTQQQASDGPPSLLNMNTSPGFFNQDQYNNQNRFGVNRGGGRGDFRRNEPYNKNRGGVWRSESNNRNNNRGNNYSSKNRSNFRDRNQRSPNRDKKKSNDNKSQVKKETNIESANNSSELKKEKDEGTEDESKKEGDEKKTAVSTKYDGLPNGILHCFVCNKSMWDGESFQNHLGGKAHKQMIASLEESFQITVNILRENMRLCEERKMIEYERMRRSRRYHQNNMQEPESHCNMCDLKFMGKIVVHRQTEGHQRLKRFLHPKCKRCNLEFPSRMEWVDHQFAADHLFKIKEYLESKELDPSEYNLRKDPEIDTEPLLDENVQNEDDNPVMELNEDLSNLYNRIPAFKPNRAVSKESLTPANGFKCDLCQLFLPSEDDSQTHLKSYKHYARFVEAVKHKYQKAAIDKKKKAEEEAAKKEEEEGEEGCGDEEETEDKAVEDENKEDADDAEMHKILDEIYDPFVADDGDEEMKLEDVSMTEVKDAVQEEAPVTPAAKRTPNTRARRGGAGGVRNGAGPKSKKAKNE